MRAVWAAACARAAVPDGTPLSPATRGEQLTDKVSHVRKPIADGDEAGGDLGIGCCRASRVFHCASGDAGRRLRRRHSRWARPDSGGATAIIPDAMQLYWRPRTAAFAAETSF